MSVFILRNMQTKWFSAFCCWKIPHSDAIASRHCLFSLCYCSPFYSMVVYVHLIQGLLSLMASTYQSNTLSVRLGTVPKFHFNLDIFVSVLLLFLSFVGVCGFSLIYIRISNKYNGILWATAEERKNRTYSLFVIAVSFNILLCQLFCFHSLYLLTPSRLSRVVCFSLSFPTAPWPFVSARNFQLIYISKQIYYAKAFEMSIRNVL